MPLAVKEFFLVFWGASAFVACLFWRDGVPCCVQVNLIHSGAEYR